MSDTPADREKRKEENYNDAFVRIAEARALLSVAIAKLSEWQVVDLQTTLGVRKRLRSAIDACEDSEFLAAQLLHKNLSGVEPASAPAAVSAGTGLGSSSPDERTGQK